ncbi:MAG: hypothetical protein IKX91_02960, partial [Firmicutes bacterium]|nr:hypothetical protein [Bacillota bacterium]
SVLKMAVIGAFVAAVVYFAFCVLGYLMNDTVRSSEEFERYFGIVPLASVPDDPSMYDGSEDDERRPNLFRRVASRVEYLSRGASKSKSKHGTKGKRK